jgi:hypothetical protein
MSFLGPFLVEMLAGWVSNRAVYSLPIQNIKSVFRIISYEREGNEAEAG